MILANIFHLFVFQKNAKIALKRPRQDYNTTGPHSNLNYRPPAPKARMPLVPGPDFNMSPQILKRVRKRCNFKLLRFCGIVLTCCFFTTTACAEENITGIGSAGDEFSFIRIQFDAVEKGWGYAGWAHDYPAAELNFLRGVTRLSNIPIHSEPAVLRLDDDRIFEFPFLYLVEIGMDGGPSFSEKEMVNLREYLLRGGFLLIDDFKGKAGWLAFRQAFQKIFPNNKWVKLDPTHPVFHVFYDINGAQRIPGIYSLHGNIPSDQMNPENWAILDYEGRIMVLINWNSDMGDGWEHTYNVNYPTKYANLAYRLGINYLVYALTH